MNADWKLTPNGRRVLQHEADARPAWVWSQDGRTLLWSNAAATYFLGKIKKHGIKLAAPAVPIKGQIARIIRLGSPGRSSLSRVQFLAGEKPASSTCACTPLEWEGGQQAVLVVGVDPIAAEFFERQGEEHADEVAVAPEQRNTSELAPAEAELESAADTDAIGTIIAEDERAYGRELDNWHAEETGGASPDADLSPETAEAEAPAEEVIAPDPAPEAETEEPAPEGRLSSLMARMVDRSELYAPLPEAAGIEPAEAEPEAEAKPDAPTLFRVTGRGFVPNQITDAQADQDDLARLDDEGGLLPDIAEDEADEFSEQAEALRNVEATREVAEAIAQAEVDMADFVRLEGGEPVGQVAISDGAEPVETVPDAEAVERVSRYNFDELSRILNDRVGETAPQVSALTEASEVRTPQPAGSPAGALINLGGETLVLNRLPLGILVFRDQQVLFANRAITEMTGYDSVERLRNAGLAAIFPAAGPDGQGAGPINHLVQRDGSMVPVTARLQSISWQGRPALMLSASATEVRTGHEAAVRAFAEAMAEARNDGFFETNRAGTISSLNARAADYLGGTVETLLGRPLSSLVAPADGAEFRAFLERPARFAETARPCTTLGGTKAGVELLVFAQGQAGVLTGYFGFVHREEIQQRPAALTTSNGEPEPALLGRISRGVRRPLNTIIGFADLLQSEAFGAIQNERYEAYAADIRTAGHEIAALVDELDDYARLKDGRYLPQRASIDLGGLLEGCVQRVRQQAAAARVIVRSAISEKLPRITADRASLAQAVLNLLASAIDQTPPGGAVVISAQTEDDGAIEIHVRDSSSAGVDMAERFVVFRDGIGRDGENLAPVRSSVGLALTRSLLAVNAFSLKVDPAGAQGMLFSLLIPADLVDYPPQH